MKKIKSLVKQCGGFSKIHVPTDEEVAAEEERRALEKYKKLQEDDEEEFMRESAKSNKLFMGTIFIIVVVALIFLGKHLFALAETNRKNFEKQCFKEVYRKNSEKPNNTYYENTECNSEYYY